MINYQKFQLSNGLRVIVSEEADNPLAVFNLLYDVGARDENPDRTGFAHLFEHLMFSGSENAESYDEEVHNAGGNANAFTSSDLTNFYITLPANNIETAFWLESDRMLAVTINEESLQREKGVVVEEFKEHYLNQPYGDAYQKLLSLSYNVHPYQWQVIGKEPAHIENATLEEVQQFFTTHYRPNRAILSVVGGVKAEEVMVLAEKWFGDIPSNYTYQRQLPTEPPQNTYKTDTVIADVPVNAIYMAFHCCSRLDPEYYATEVIGEILSGGASGRLYRRLVKDNPLFSSLNGFTYGHFDKDLFYVEGKLHQNVSFEQALAAIWEQLELLKTERISSEELQKCINKVESSIVFAEVNPQDKAFSLAYYELLGDIDSINTELTAYENVTDVAVQQTAQQLFRPENCSVLCYQAKTPQEQ
ncbi:MAG: insulinase family protein [Chitinophagales bacterium]|jgi:predicted Zn-dependent peptidase|nr:insulinase family protein [Chitinophagales bacterium]